ncbi:hypothetical protein M0R45_006285 [Rubus argutus]|uniref:Uncharacterized protein n=1 Tax=Rubus argutus TaxID=59490 RepID=A0AAW1YQI4_RUBAR
MAEAAKRDLQTPKRSSKRSDPKSSSPSLAPPPTPLTVTPRRSARRQPRYSPGISWESKKSKHREEGKLSGVELEFSPVSPEQSERKKRKRGHERTVVTRGMASKNSKSGEKLKRQVFYKKVVYDGGEFEVGDDVYVKRERGRELRRRSG